MTLTQLSTFVLVARLGSVKAAAVALGVSESAVSQALAALRRYLGDQLLTRNAEGNGVIMTAGGSRLLMIAAQMLSLRAEAESVVRSAEGSAEQLRLIAPSAVVECVAGPLADAFTARVGGSIEVSVSAAGTAEMAALISQCLADVAIGPYLGGELGPGVVSEPITRCRLVVFGSPGGQFRGSPARWPWLVESSAVDPGSDVSTLLRNLGVPDQQLSVFPNQTAAWEAAARGDGVAPGIAHLAVHRLRRRDLEVVAVPGTPIELSWYATTLSAGRRSMGAAALRHFLGTAEAVKLLHAPGTGVAPSRFRAPASITMWSRSPPGAHLEKVSARSDNP